MYYDLCVLMPMCVHVCAEVRRQCQAWFHLRHGPSCLLFLNINFIYLCACVLAYAHKCVHQSMHVGAREKLVVTFSLLPCGPCQQFRSTAGFQEHANVCDCSVSYSPCLVSHTQETLTSRAATAELCYFHFCS